MVVIQCVSVYVSYEKYLLVSIVKLIQGVLKLLVHISLYPQTILDDILQQERMDNWTYRARSRA